MATSSVPAFEPWSAKTEKLLINISGQRFETWRSTLEKYPETLLGSNEREAFYDAESKEYFFDRNPEIFRQVLDYYQTGRLHYPRQECLTRFEEELRFFKISAELIGDCCYEDYQDRKRENAERLLIADLPKHSDESLQPPTCTRSRLWRALEHPRSSTAGLCFAGLIGVTIIVFILANIVETGKKNENSFDELLQLFSAFAVPCGMRPGRAGSLSCGERYHIVFFFVAAACVLIFTAEYLLRLYAAPSRLKFMCSLMSVIDLVAILPFYLSLLLTDNEDLSDTFVTIRVLRIFFIFKLSRQFKGLQIFCQTFKSFASSLGLLIFTLAMAITIFATLIFYAEKNVDATNFTSIPAAFWYTIVTMTTLGYGDMVS